MGVKAWLAVARYGGTAVTAGLIAAYGYYPSVHWLPIAITVMTVLGFHVVPAADRVQYPLQRVVVPVQAPDEGSKP
jgi:hypothetical protein